MTRLLGSREAASLLNRMSFEKVQAAGSDFGTYSCHPVVQLFNSLIQRLDLREKTIRLGLEVMTVPAAAR